ncbi:MAG TPA: hypothetical protein VMB25_07180 [Bryobacteraceae bacterium]|nr:hypothetical protein [Bryobacteraceae bacterium]
MAAFGDWSARPTVSSVTIDGDKIWCESVSVALTTHPNRAGKPAIGAFHVHIEIVVDLHNNITFDVLKKLFELSKVITLDKIKDVTIDFWLDESHQDVICSYSLRGWISHFQTHSGGGSNHTLVMTIQPTLDDRSVFDIDMNN